MRLARYNTDRLGLVRGPQIVDVTEALAAVDARRRLAPPGDGLAAALGAVADRVEEVRKSGFVQLHSSVTLRSPIADPTRIAVARAPADSESPGLSLCDPVPAGAGEGVALAAEAGPVDCEAGLALVTGRTAADVAEDEALDYVAGYTIGLLPAERAGSPVLGPWLVSADEIADPDSLRVRVRVNGAGRGAGAAAERAGICRRLVAAASRLWTLHPGDTIVAAAPGGPFPLRPGDRVACEVDRIGALEAAVRAR